MSTGTHFEASSVVSRTMETVFKNPLKVFALIVYLSHALHGWVHYETSLPNSGNPCPLCKGSGFMPVTVTMFGVTAPVYGASSLPCPWCLGSGIEPWFGGTA